MACSSLFGYLGFQHVHMLNALSQLLTGLIMYAVTPFNQICNLVLLNKQYWKCPAAPETDTLPVRFRLDWFQAPVQDTPRWRKSNPYPHANSHMWLHIAGESWYCFLLFNLFNGWYLILTQVSSHGCCLCLGEINHKFCSGFLTLS